MSEQKCTTQNQIRLTKYSCAEVSGPSEAPRFVGKLILIFQGNQADVRALDNRMFARTNESYVVRNIDFLKNNQKIIDTN